MIIRTKYVGPRGFRGSKVVATTTVAGRRRQKTVGYDPALSQWHNADVAARALAQAAGIRVVENLTTNRPGRNSFKAIARPTVTITKD